jgi:hypothetical protein
MDNSRSVWQGRECDLTGYPTSPPPMGVVEHFRADPWGRCHQPLSIPPPQRRRAALLLRDAGERATSRKMEREVIADMVTERFKIASRIGVGAGPHERGVGMCTHGEPHPLLWPAALIMAGSNLLGLPILRTSRPAGNSIGLIIHLNDL